MSKLVGLMFLAALVGTSVVAWSRSTGQEIRGPSAQSDTLSPSTMHLKMDAKSLPVQKFNDMSFVFTESD
jgi:predicted metal-binding membrane protein